MSLLGLRALVLVSHWLSFLGPSVQQMALSLSMRSLDELRGHNGHERSRRQLGGQECGHVGLLLAFGPLIGYQYFDSSKSKFRDIFEKKTEKEFKTTEKEWNDETRGRRTWHHRLPSLALSFGGQSSRSPLYGQKRRSGESKHMLHPLILLQILCEMSSLLLLLALLSSFFWTLLHALLLFRMAHNVFHVTIRLRLLFLIGYAAPSLVALVGLVSVLPNSDFSLSRALVGSDFLWDSLTRDSVSLLLSDQLLDQFSAQSPKRLASDRWDLYHVTRPLITRAI